MAESFRIDRLALHYIDAKNDRIDIVAEELNLKELDPLVIGFLERLILETYNAKEEGSVYSANFSEQGPATTKRRIERIIAEPDAFFTTSVLLARTLYTASPSNASTGLLAVVRIIEIEGKIVRVALLKIPNKDESVVKLRGGAFTQITVEDIENQLADRIQKAAIIPHPNKDDFELKVIDKQVQNDPARYFGDSFLGAITKKSDEYQLSHLLPTIRQYASEREIDIDDLKLADLIEVLKQENTDVTTPLLARVVIKEKVFLVEIDAADFEKFIDEESDVGPLKIPALALIRKGRRQRMITLTFKGNLYVGLEIKGPLQTVNSLLTHVGGQTTLTITDQIGTLIYK